MSEKLREIQGKRLANARADAGFRSARAAAIECGWKESSYRAHEAGTRTIGQDDAERYARVFRSRGVKVTAKSILFGEDRSAHDDDAFKTIDPVLVFPEETGFPGWVADEKPNVVIEADVRSGAGGGGVRHSERVVTDSNGNTYAAEGIAGEWSIPQHVMTGMLHASPQHITAFEVIGDSMEPRLRSGDRVFVDRRMTFPNPEGIFVLWDGYSVVVKRLEIVRGSDPVRLRVISVNPQYQPYEVIADDVNIIGRFVGRFTTE